MDRAVLTKPFPILRGCAAEEVKSRWSEFVPLIRKALARGAGEFAPEDILEGLALDGTMQLWIFEEPGGNVPALAVTQILNFPRKRYCQILLAATDKRMGKRFWQAMIKPVTEWAIEYRCSAIRVLGRDGWGPVMGWPKIYNVFEREI